MLEHSKWQKRKERFCEDGLVESEVDGLISELDRVTFMVSMEGR